MPVTVTFNETAATPDAGTSPGRSVTLTCKMLPPDTFVEATGRIPEFPGRVSNTRDGVTDVNDDPDANHPLTSTIRWVGANENKQISPDADTGAITALATVAPAA